MSELVTTLVLRPDIARSRFDQSTYEGRARHFFATVNPLNLFASAKQLDDSRQIVTEYKNGRVSPSLTVCQLWKAKELYDSAFHPESGEKQFIFGRMSAQVPANMIITGGMLTFYRSTRGVIFWHWLNQTFNATTNYTNRSGPNALSNERLMISYLSATGGALFAALGLNSLVKNTAGLMGRLVPFAAISVANAINIPLMRSTELEKGIEVRTEDGQLVGESRKVAVLAILQVLVSRISMALPYMILTPIAMNRVAKSSVYKVRPWIAGPFQTILAGIGVGITTPLCCAFFPQQSSVKVSWLEPELQEKLKTKFAVPPTHVYYNKGL